MRFSHTSNAAADEIEAAINAARQTDDEITLMIARQMGMIPDSYAYAYHPQQKSFFLNQDGQYHQQAYSHEYLNKVMQSYLKMWESQRNDFTRRVPFKTVRKEPKNFMGGVLGYTILNEGWIVLRDDLEGELKQLVDVHESIHTPDEYETRVITSWMLSDEKPRYEQY